jgi:transcriptional regulator with XRE-family HTH domain
MDNRALAQLLRDLRQSRKVTLREAADGLDIDPSHLSRLERGEKKPSPELRDRVAHYYRIDVDELRLADGGVPDDVVEILRAHPEAIDRLRSEYGRSS